MVEQGKYPKRRIDSEPFLSQLDVIEKAKIDLHSVPTQLYSLSTNRKTPQNYVNLNKTPSVVSNNSKSSGGGTAHTGLGSLESLTPLSTTNMGASPSMSFGNNMVNPSLLMSNNNSNNNSTTPVFDPFSSVDLNNSVGLGSNKNKTLFSSSFMDSYDNHNMQSKSTSIAPPNIWGDYNDKGFSGDATVWG